MNFISFPFPSPHFGAVSEQGNGPIPEGGAKVESPADPWIIESSVNDFLIY